MNRMIVRDGRNRFVIQTVGRGPQGIQGPKGDTGEGLPTGGSEGQVLTKVSSSDHDTVWETPPNAKVTSVNAKEGDIVLDADDISDASTTKKFTTEDDITKLAGIEEGADVTNSTNVNAAGAVMEADTTTAGMSFVLDEDNMGSNSATKVPTQQSVKAYADTKVDGNLGATDSKLPRTDGTGGKTLKSSDISVSDDDDLTLPAGTFAAGMDIGSKVYPEKVIVDWNYTQTTEPSNLSTVGTAFVVNWNSTIDSLSILGATAQAGFFGPRGVFQLEGLVRYNKNTAYTTLAPIGFGDQLKVANTAGSPRTITPSWVYMAQRWYIADGAAVTLMYNDSAKGGASFVDNPIYTVTNGGTLNGVATGFEHITVMTHPFVMQGASLHGVIGMLIHDINATNSDDAPVPPGEPAPGGSVELNTGIRIDYLSFADQSIGIDNASTLVNRPLTQTLDAASDTIRTDASLVYLDNTTGATLTLTSTPTIADGIMEGHTLTLVNTSANNVVLQGEGDLGSTNIVSDTITLKPNGSTTLVYTSDGWVSELTNTVHDHSTDAEGGKLPMSSLLENTQMSAGGGAFRVSSLFSVPVIGIYTSTSDLVPATMFTPAAVQLGGGAATPDVVFDRSAANTLRISLSTIPKFVLTNTLLDLSVELRTSVVGTNSASVLTVAGTQTPTNKTISLANNTLTGTTAQFNTALSDGDFATLAGTETLTNKNLSSSTITYRAASDTVVGAVELATAAETNTGSDATRAVTPDGLAESYAGTKNIAAYVIDAATVITTGDGKAYFRIPSNMNGMNLVVAAAGVNTASSSGTPTIQIARGRQAAPGSAHTYVDMLSTRITIDANEYDSTTAATAAVIDAANDDVATGDMIRIDVDVAGTGAQGLNISLQFRLP